MGLCILGSSLIFSAQGGRGKEKNLKLAAKIFASPSEGEAEGGCGGNSASPEPKRSPAALLVQSRSQQKSFLFLLPARIATQSVAGGEEKIGRAQIKNLKKTFLLGGERSERRRGVAFKIRSPDFRQKKFGFRPTNTTILN